MVCKIDFNKRVFDNNDTEKYVDSIISDIGKKIVEYDSEHTDVNEERVKQIELSYKLLSHMIVGDCVNVTYKLHDMFNDVGTISIEGNNIIFSDTDWFLTATKYASNVDIYPKTNGKIQIDLCFYGLTK